MVQEDISEYNSSYFYTVDKRIGWGNTSVFTFLSEFNRGWPAAQYIEAIVLFLLFIVSTLGNAYTVIQVVRHKRLRTITNYFVCNLALADLLYTIGCPFIAITRITSVWVLGNAACRFVFYTEFVCGTVMIWTMAVISVDRYIGMRINLRKVKRLEPKHVLFVCVIIWIFGSACFIPVPIFFFVVEVEFGSSTVKICTILWPRFGKLRLSLIYTIASSVFCIFLPLFIICCAYIHVFKRMIKSSRAVNEFDTYVPRMWKNSVSLYNPRRRRNVKVLKMLVLLVVLYVLMWLPLCVVFLRLMYGIMNNDMDIASHVLVLVMIFSFCNACINPFLYGIINGRIKTAILKRRYFCCKCKKSQEKITTAVISMHQTTF